MLLQTLHTRTQNILYSDLKIKLWKKKFEMLYKLIYSKQLNYSNPLNYAFEHYDNIIGSSAQSLKEEVVQSNKS